MMEFELRPRQVLDLSQCRLTKSLTDQSGESIEMRIQGESGSQFILPLVEAGLDVQILVCGSVHLRAKEVQGTVSLAPWNREDQEMEGSVSVTVELISVGGLLHVANLGRGEHLKVDLVNVRGKAELTLAASGKGSVEAAAKVDRSEGGQVLISGVVEDDARVELRVTEVGDALENGVVSTLSSVGVLGSARVVMCHEVIGEAARYSNLSIEDAGVLEVRLAFPPALVGGEVTIDGLTLKAGPRHNPALGLALESGATLGGEVVTFRDLEASGGLVQVNGPGSAPQAGLAVPGRVSIGAAAGQARGVNCAVRVTSLSPDFLNEGERPLTTVRLDDEMPGLHIDAPGCAVVRPGATSTASPSITEGAASLPPA